MASPSTSSEIPHAAAPAPSALANAKANAAPPKVTGGNTVELDNMAAPAEKLPLHEDIMQLARLGEIGPMKTLFETGKFDARYKDQEDITPLHVSQDVTPRIVGYELCLQAVSGLPSTIIMRYANTSSSPAQRSTQKAASLLRPLQCGLLSDVTSTLSISYLDTAQIHFSLTDRVTTCFI